MGVGTLQHVNFVRNKHTHAPSLVPEQKQACQHKHVNHPPFWRRAHFTNQKDQSLSSTDYCCNKGLVAPEDSGAESP